MWRRDQPTYHRVKRAHKVQPSQAVRAAVREKQHMPLAVNDLLHFQYQIFVGLALVAHRKVKLQQILREEPLQLAGNTGIDQQQHRGEWGRWNLHVFSLAAQAELVVGFTAAALAILFVFGVNFNLRILE